MSPRLVTIIAVLFTVSLAHAGENKMTIGQAIDLRAALETLDGYTRVERDQVVKVPYNLGGSLRIAIARCLTALKGEAETFNAARNALINEVSGGSGLVKPDTAENNRFVTEIEKVLKKESGVSCPRFRLEELKLEVNPIPPGVLSNLAPILE